MTQETAAKLLSKVKYDSDVCFISFRAISNQETIDVSMDSITNTQLNFPIWTEKDWNNWLEEKKYKNIFLVKVTFTEKNSPIFFSIETIGISEGFKKITYRDGVNTYSLPIKSKEESEQLYSYQSIVDYCNSHKNHMKLTP